MEPKLTKEEKKEIRKQERQEWEQQLDTEKRNSLFKKIALWGGIAIFLAIGVWGIYAASTQPSTSATQDIKLPPVTSSDFQTGSKDAKATLVEYADFQCPACKAYYPVIKQLQQTYGDKLHFVYRFFPLENIHRNAVNAAQAAYAANLQGKFWEMHDKLFETQDSWADLTDPSDTFVGFAKSLGLNVEQFTKDYNADAAKKFAEDSYNSALNMGLQGTPSFFLNGKYIENPQGYEPFKQLIDAQLQTK